MNIIKSLICAVFLYLYVYSPAFFFMPFGLDKVILAISLLYLLFSGEGKRFTHLFKKEIRFFSIIALLSLFVTVIHNGFVFEGIVMYDFFLLIEVLTVPYCIMVFFSFSWKCNISNLLIINAIIAGSISVFLLLNPAWADLMKYQILKAPDFLTTNFAFRGFGLSDGLVFGYPVVQGFCASFVICGFIRGNPLYYLGLIPIIVSVFVNARSGIVPIAVALLVLVLNSPIKKITKTTIPLLAVLLVVLLFYNPGDDSQLSESVEWGMSFFNIIGDFFSGKEAENMDALSLTGSMVQWPHSLSAWVVGEGVNLFGNTTFKDYGSSDIGFCIRTVYGGILYMVLWASLCLFMFRRLLRVHKTMALILFISLLYLNWKSDFFIVTVSCRFFFLLYVCSLMDSSFMKAIKRNVLK